MEGTEGLLGRLEVGAVPYIGPIGLDLIGQHDVDRLIAWRRHLSESNNFKISNNLCKDKKSEAQEDV
jgi:hypothetical protein